MYWYWKQKHHPTLKWARRQTHLLVTFENNRSCLLCSGSVVKRSNLEMVLLRAGKAARNGTQSVSPLAFELNRCEEIYGGQGTHVEDDQHSYLLDLTWISRKGHWQLNKYRLKMNKEKENKIIIILCISCLRKYIYFVKITPPTSLVSVCWKAMVGFRKYIENNLATSHGFTNNR